MDTINSRLAGILLVEKGLTSYEVGKNIGAPTQSVDNWLKGKNGRFVMPGADWVAKICKVYKISCEYALSGVGSKYANIIAQTTGVAPGSKTDQIISVLEDHLKDKERTIKVVEGTVRDKVQIINLLEFKINQLEENIKKAQEKGVGKKSEKKSH